MGVKSDQMFIPADVRSVLSDAAIPGIKEDDLTGEDKLCIMSGSQATN